MSNFIKHVNIEITNQCNQRCYYCFNSSGEASKNELSLETWVSVLQVMKQWGLKSILVTGGEPFIRPRIMEFLDKTQSLGLETSILSNGFKVPEFAETHKEVIKRLKIAQISLDAMTPSLHDVRRGVTGAWKQATEAIEALIGLRVDVEISCTVSDENLDELTALGSYAKFIGAKLLIRPINLIGRACSAIMPVDFWQRLKAIVISLQDDNVNCIHDRFQYVPVSKSFWDNSLDEDVITIEPNGEFRCTSVSICGFSGVGNVRRFLEVA